MCQATLITLLFTTVISQYYQCRVDTAIFLLHHKASVAVI